MTLLRPHRIDVTFCFSRRSEKLVPKHWSRKHVGNVWGCWNGDQLRLGPHMKPLVVKYLSIKEKSIRDRRVLVSNASGVSYSKAPLK